MPTLAKNLQQAPVQASEPSVFYHPNYIVRVAGEPIDLLAFEGRGQTARAIEAKHALESQLDVWVSDACDTLEQLIAGQQDKQLARDLINSKRALFNRKHIKPAALARLEQSLAPESFAAINQAQRALCELAEADTHIAEVYEQEVAAGNAHLQTVWQQPNIRQGVSYSNPKLFRDFEAEYGVEQTGRLAGKKKRKLDDTLFQYLTRCATKTSPLSALTPVYVGRWSERAGESVNLAFDGQTENRVMLKSGLLKQVIDRLFSDSAVWRDTIPVQLNSSLQFVAGGVRFTRISKGNTAGGKTWGTGEDRIDLKLNPLLQCILHVMHQRPPMQVTALIAAVCQVAPKLTPEFVGEYVEKLIGAGLLMPDLPMAEQADALVWTKQLLQRFGDRFSGGIAALEQLAAQVAEFPQAAHGRRAELTEAIELGVQAFAEAVGSAVDAHLARPAFFENTYLTRNRQGLSEAAMAGITKNLETVLQLAPLLDMNQKVQAQFADFYLHKFGPDHVCDQPLALIREFDEIYGVAQFGFQQLVEKRAPASDIYKQYSKIADSWDAFLKPFLQSKDDVDITAERIRSLTDQLPQAIKNRSLSHSYVGQLFQSEGEAKFVINQVFGGNSGLLSRFLEILPEPQLEEIKTYLKRCARHDDYAELPGVFGFNANKHPRMADREVVIPPFAPNWEDTDKIDINRLRFRYDATTHKVCFVDTGGRFLDVFYQGFLIPSLMPQVQRFIAINNAHGLNFFTIGTLFNCNLIKKDEVTVVPRVSVDKLVLSRRMHLVPRAFVPSPDLPPVEFYQAVQAWRAACNLPEEAFIRAFPIGDGKVPGVDSEVDWSTISFKDAKPFYVRFDDPRFVRLLARILKRSPFDLTITEVLPRIDDQHVEVDGRAHVSEMQIELSKRVSDPLQGSNQ